MKTRWKNVVLTVMTLAILLGLVLAVPLGTLTDEAQARYLEAGPADPEDEYAFLFDE